MADAYMCKFTCHGCGKKDVEFAVRWRKHDEDMVDFLETAVRPAMGAAHTKVAPMCLAPACDLYLPAPAGTNGIGRPVLN